MTSNPSTPEPATAVSQIRFGGVGGQGIVLAGTLLGKAAALFDGKEAVCTQTYGPETRGGASRSDVIISTTDVDYPFVTSADVLAVLFQEAYVKFRDAVQPDGKIFVDTGLVQAGDDGVEVSGLPATEIAEELGNRLASNVVMLGYLVQKTGIVSRESVEDAIRATLKPHIVDLNLRALAAGFEQAKAEEAQ